MTEALNRHHAHDYYLIQKERLNTIPSYTRFTSPFDDATKLIK